MSVSTHVLDAGHGRPAAGVPVRLERSTNRDGDWLPVADGSTDADGRLANWVADTPAGTYRLIFDTSAHSDFYPQVTIAFVVADGEHYHVPLLLSPFAYSTYRGS